MRYVFSVAKRSLECGNTYDIIASPRDDKETKRKSTIGKSAALSFGTMPFRSWTQCLPGKKLPRMADAILESAVSRTVED